MISVATGHLMSGGFDPFIGRFQRRRSISTLVAGGGQAELCSSINENLDRLAIGETFAHHWCSEFYLLLVAIFFTFLNFILSLVGEPFLLFCFDLI